MTVQHVVLFKFPEDTWPDLQEEFRERVQAWPAALPGLQALRLGEDLTGERTKGYQVLLYSEFADTDALVAYQTHPHHQDFLAWMRGHSGEPLAFDYALDESTVYV